MKITFNINFHTVWGQQLYIVGSIPELGAWEPALAKPMTYTADGNWTLTLDADMPAGETEIAYRYFLGVGDKRIFEEWERNHCLRLDGRSAAYALYDYWQVRPEHLAFYSSAFTRSLFAHPCNRHERVVRSGKKLVIKISAPRVERNQCVAITGNQPCLGNWHPDKALLLSCDTFPEWHIDLDATEIQFPLEYKFLIWDEDTRQPLYWERDENRLLNAVPQEMGETVVISGLYFRDSLPLWRCAGSVIPVFSLRSERSFGVGDLGDLRLLVDWAKKTHQRIIQVLPMNDTTTTHTWRDSYPYSAISIYALHPMYIDLTALGRLKQPERVAFYREKQHELNELETVDYERVMRYKLDYCREYFGQWQERLLNEPDFKAFVAREESWLMPYAAYCFLRDSYGTSDFSRWEGNSRYSASRVRALCRPGSDAWQEISFTYFLQYTLDKQFREVSDYARRNGIVLKGDLPIGVSRTSVEAWTEPRYFNMSGQAGAPPDDFSTVGQNWGFPTYNWKVMGSDNLAWWRHRFAKLSDYFDCFRIDHILGFFRIWEIPDSYVEGLCGHFTPALPLTVEEIEQRGLRFDEQRFTRPQIHERYLPELFGKLASEVADTYLVRTTAERYALKPFCDTQRKVEALFAGKAEADSACIKKGLFAIANEVLFLRDPREADKYHPRISASQSYVYQELDAGERYAFDQLYWDFFYHRHNDFWKATAYERLTPLVASTRMLACGEDLGMIPASVPEVMNRLQILSLEVERMPKAAGREFTDLLDLPYHSVCTTSTHDMSPLRLWWTEDRAKTERYYNQVLRLAGNAPEECTAEVAERILANHLATRSMLVIIPLQDWFAMDDAIKRPDAAAERINIPAEPNHYWRYRMHITLERLLEEERFNERIIRLINEAGRH